MPAKSKAQKTAMCMALAARKGDLSVSKLKGAALEIYKSDMTNNEIEEFTVLKENNICEYIENRNMKSLQQHINESLNESIIKENKYNYRPKNKTALFKLVNDLLVKRGDEADLNDIDVSKITDMSELFHHYYTFNGDISKWDVSNVKNMDSMFHSSSFNGDISKWDVSSVENMHFMFLGSSFNGDISKWDVSNVTDMNSMFEWTYFNGDISAWNINKQCDTRDMLKRCHIQDKYKPKGIE